MRSSVTVYPAKRLRGAIRAPPSKAYTHRAIIASSLAEGRSAILRPLECHDCAATIDAVEAYGATVEKKGYGLWVQGARELKTPEDVVNCRESGSTIRFVTPVVSKAPGITVLTGAPSLRRRPMSPLLQSLKDLGVTCYSTTGDGRPPLVVFGGGLKGGETSITGSVSSQFISGLIFAGSLAAQPVTLTLTSKLESRPYVEMTLNIMRRHGVKVETSKDWGWFRVVPQRGKAIEHEVPGDYSSAAFLLAAASICRSKVTVENLEEDSLQGDRAIVGILREMGTSVRVHEDAVETMNTEGGLNAVRIDARDTPDLVPACAALACYAKGQTEITGAERLRIKESDRIASIAAELRKMGADIKPLEDGLVVRGPCRLRGAVVDPHDDHRIAMACAVAALGARGKTEILNAKCVSKSYPGFFRDLKRLGVKVSGR